MSRFNSHTAPTTRGIRVRCPLKLNSTRFGRIRRAERTADTRVHPNLNLRICRGYAVLRGYAADPLRSVNAALVLQQQTAMKESTSNVYNSTVDQLMKCYSPLTSAYLSCGKNWRYHML